jgi:hypothetical protein
MDEAEWRTSTDPDAMLTFLRDRAGRRKLRLYCVACCCRIWDLLDDQRSREAVEVAERYADGLAGEEERRAAAERVLTMAPDKAHAAAIAAYMAVEAIRLPYHFDTTWGIAAAV